MNYLDILSYSGIIIILLIIFLYECKNVLQELKNVRILLTKLNENDVAHEIYIQNFDKRINDHSLRIKEIERKQDQCQYCNE